MALLEKQDGGTAEGAWGGVVFVDGAAEAADDCLHVGESQNSHAGSYCMLKCSERSCVSARQST